MTEHEYLQEMYTGLLESPNDLQAVDNELREASLELNHANERYYNAILARIALRTTLRMESIE